MNNWFLVLSAFFGIFCDFPWYIFRSNLVNNEHIPNDTYIDGPLFLTPYIEEGKILEGQTAAKVRLPGTNITSFSGYLTVNKTFNSNLFFWFFPSEKDPQNAPVLLWLQGGPGSSSLLGVFTQNGPFYIGDDGLLNKRQYYWSQLFSVIYIDNPIGAGFSFTENDAEYATEQVKIGKDLYCSLIQFFKLFPDLQKNDFYLTGESYAGKYIPAVGITIHTNNKVNKEKINLKGLAIASGFSDPVNMVGFADLVFQLGLIDSKTKEIMRKQQDSLVGHIRKNDFEKASREYWLLLFELHMEAGHEFDPHNYLKPITTQHNLWKYYIETDAFRRRIHVGNRSFNEANKVSYMLDKDLMKSVKPWVEVLVENYRVMFFNGQLDVLVGYPLSLNFLKKLNWSGAEMYRTAPRKSWLVEGELAGFTKSVKGFTEVMVRNAGHAIPMDQPKWTLDLINRFGEIKNYSFSQRLSISG